MKPARLRPYRLVEIVLLILLPGCLAAALPAVAAAATSYRVIPASGPRLMWQNGDGYCGEVSLQVAGIQLGFWVGQNQARKLAGGEALLGVNYDTLLGKLHLSYSDWSGGTAATDRQNFMDWIRDGLMTGYPVIFGAKTHDTWGTDPDYDHIMIADAVTTSQAVGGGYNAADTMSYADGIDGTENTLTFDQWVNGSTNVNQYYYLPPKATVVLSNGKKVKCNGYQYGVMITGVAGASECRPVSMTPVTPKSESNVTQGGTSSTMNATVTMSGLTAGTTYTLLRWDCTYKTIGSVPFSNFLRSATSANVVSRFTATGPTATCNVTFMSDGVTFFRCCAGTVS